jgi:hypothetical protein
MRDDTAFQVRIHAYAPGWDFPKLNPNEQLTSHFGLVSDFLSECWSRRRDGSRLAAMQDRIHHLGGALSGRDIEGVNKTVSALIKLLFPDPQMIPDDSMGWRSSWQPPNSTATTPLMATLRPQARLGHQPRHWRNRPQPLSNRDGPWTRQWSQDPQSARAPCLPREHQGGGAERLRPCQEPHGRPRPAGTRTRGTALPTRGPHPLQGQPEPVA